VQSVLPDATLPRRSDVHGKAPVVSLLAQSAGGAPGSAAEQWRALARQQALLAAAPDDEVLGELLVLQARIRTTQCHATTIVLHTARCRSQTPSYMPLVARRATLVDASKLLASIGGSSESAVLRCEILGWRPKLNTAAANSQPPFATMRSTMPVLSRWVFRPAG